MIVISQIFTEIMLDLNNITVTIPVTVPSKIFGISFSFSEKKNGKEFILENSVDILLEFRYE